MKERKLLIDNMIVNATKFHTVDQLRLFYNILYIYKKEVNFESKDISEELCFGIDDIKPLIANYRMSFSHVYDVIESMPKTINFITKDAKYQGSISVFEYFVYDFENEEFCIKFTDFILPYLFDLEKSFCNLNLNEFETIKDKYPQRLYELLSCYKNQKTLKIKIEVLRRYLNVPENYKVSDFKKKIIEKSILNLNKNTSFDIDYTVLKTSNKITHVIFKIK